MVWCKGCTGTSRSGSNVAAAAGGGEGRGGGGGYDIGDGGGDGGCGGGGDSSSGGDSSGSSSGNSSSNKRCSNSSSGGGPASNIFPPICAVLLVEPGKLPFAEEERFDMVVSEILGTCQSLIGPTYVVLSSADHVAI